MKHFNSTELSAFHGVWVICEQRGGAWLPADFELLSEGRRLADDLGCALTGVALGGDSLPNPRELGGYGADRVLVCGHAELGDYRSEPYAEVLCDLIAERKPEIVLFAATMTSRELAPRCAARLHTGLCADCTGLVVRQDKYIDFLKNNSTLSTEAMSETDYAGDLKMTRPAFGGHLMATIVCPRFRPQMATVRPGVMVKAAFDEARAAACEVERVAAEVSAESLRVQVLETVRQVKETVDLTAAEVIVSVGYGISRDPQKGIALARELAAALGGTVGASRAVTDAGWLSADLQIGQTGKTVRPRLYIALGISGAIQHKAGMQDAETIIAVNKNGSAPIFEGAAYGIVGDLYTVVPLLLDALKTGNAQA